MARPVELSLELVPRARYDTIDVTRRLAEQYGEVLGRYPRALYCSYHTTAGYLEQSLSSRLKYSRQYVDGFIRLFQRLFPPDANYRHDQLDLRQELSLEQREREPKNADSHLAFIGSGLANCATYKYQEGAPVYFIDLDGVVPGGSRRRRTTVLAYDDEAPVGERSMEVAVSPHPVDSVDLRHEQAGVLAEIADWVAASGVEHGRLDIALEATERHVGLTVNEFETLLMQHDLADVLRDPLRFMALKGKNALRDPLAIPTKTLGYARYDLVQLFNEAMDALHISESALEGLLARCLALPVSRFLRLKRSVSLMVVRGEIVCGTYQSPILLQWRRPADGRRRLRASLVRFE